LALKWWIKSEHNLNWIGRAQNKVLFWAVLDTAWCLEGDINTGTLISREPLNYRSASCGLMPFDDFDVV
jgi:hypothetical protein